MHTFNYLSSIWFYPWNLIFFATKRRPSDGGVCTCHVLIRVESIRRNFLNKHLRIKPSKITVHIDVACTFDDLPDESTTNYYNQLHFKYHFMSCATLEQENNEHLKTICHQFYNMYDFRKTLTFLNICFQIYNRLFVLIIYFLYARNIFIFRKVQIGAIN